MKLPPWALPVIPIVAAGVALAALIVNVTKSTDWAIPGYIGAALCIVLAIAGVRLAVVSTSERRKRLRRAREVVSVLLGTGKILQHQPGYQNLSPGCEPLSATEYTSSTATTAYSGPLRDLPARSKHGVRLSHSNSAVGLSREVRIPLCLKRVATAWTLCSLAFEKSSHT